MHLRHAFILHANIFLPIILKVLLLYKLSIIASTAFFLFGILTLQILSSIAITRNQKETS